MAMYVQREPLIKLVKLKSYGNTKWTAQEVIDLIKSIPSEKFPEVPVTLKAVWNESCQCTHCKSTAFHRTENGEEIYYPSAYCPWCGAEMINFPDCINDKK